MINFPFDIAHNENIEFTVENGVEFITTDIQYLFSLIEKIDYGNLSFDFWTLVIKTIAFLRGYKIEKWERKKLRIFNLRILARTIIKSDYYLNEVLNYTKADFEKCESQNTLKTNENIFPAQPIGNTLTDYVSAGLIKYTAEERIVCPIYLLPTLKLIQNNCNTAELLDLLKKVRNNLLRKNLNILYSELLNYMKQATTDQDSIYNCLEPKEYAETYVVEYICYIKKRLGDLRLREFKNYKELILDGQLETWDGLGKSYFELKGIYDKINSLDLLVYRDSYGKTADSMAHFLNLYSRAFSIITVYEKRMGLDRHLTYSIAKEDFSLLNEIFIKIKKLVEEKSREAKEFFQANWNISLVSDAISGMFGLNQGNVLNRYIPVNQDRVFLFVLDGYGLCQHYWNKNCFDKKESFTYGVQLFNWLSNKNDFTDNLMLGTSLITDTCAGLSTLFTGKLPKESGLVASKVMRNGYLYKNVKNCSEEEFDRLCDPRVESFLKLFTDNQIYNQVYYGSTLHKNAFSNLCFDGAIISEERIPERIFNRILTSIKESEKQLIVSYYPKLDSTGHPTGAFTLFELFEHEKLNFLFTNFVIELVKEKPWLFNGHNSIIITADHGMAETSQNVIKKSEFEFLVPDFIDSKSKIIENNRSLLIYGVKENKIKEATELITNYLISKEVMFDIYTKDSEVVQNTIFKKEDSPSSKNCPDIMVLLNGPGIFFDYDLPIGSYHLGAHGGSSIEESLVPFLVINLTQQLKEDFEKRFLKLG